MSALNFDPYAALAEIQGRALLHATPATPATKADQSLVSVATVAGLAVARVENAKSPAGFSVTADPAAWSAALALLDTSRPPARIEPDRWAVILADARWIARVYGDNAAALGWSASDLFGLSDHPGEGGLADRLEGARRLAFTSSVAHWRGEECEGWLWRRTLTAKPVLWEA